MVVAIPSATKKWTRATKADKNFVVDDDELTCQHALAEPSLKRRRTGRVVKKPTKRSARGIAKATAATLSRRLPSLCLLRRNWKRFTKWESCLCNEICGDWGATVRGDKTNDPHWATLAGMRIGKERVIFEAWKKLVSN